MLAWQFHTTGQPLRLVEVPEPIPAEGEVVIDVHTCGLCHSDATIQYNPVAFTSLPFTPLTLGHEIAGTVAELGPGVTQWKIGQRVAVWSTPRTQSIPGFTRQGGYAEKHLAPATDLVALPDEVSFSQGSYAADAAMTAYSGMVRRGGVQQGWKVGIIGYGGLGQVGARIAQLKGADVHVAETKAAAREAATTDGFTQIVGDVSQWQGQNFNLIVDYAGFDTTGVALNSVRPFGGRVVQVGANKGETTIGISGLLRDKDLLGSFGGLLDDLREVLNLMATGELDPAFTEIPFSDVEDGLVRLHHGEVTGRQVAVVRPQ